MREPQADCASLITMHHRPRETAGETGRVIVVKSPISIIYHLRSDPGAREAIHHGRTNKRAGHCLVMKYLLPSRAARADISVQIRAAGWTLRHLSAEWRVRRGASLFARNVQPQREVMNHSDSGASEFQSTSPLPPGVGDKSETRK